MVMYVEGTTKIENQKAISVCIKFSEVSLQESDSHLTRTVESVRAVVERR